jgi:endonuclease/exonuclease/phosphatase family metal-dependent hydrolase
MRAAAGVTANVSHPFSVDEPDHNVRLLSYNIHKGIGGRDRRYQLGRIIEVIDHERPDLILLQEVTHNTRRSRYHDQTRLLSEHFGLADAAYQMNVHLKSGGYGNLLLTRWPLSSRHQVSLRLANKKPRGAQVAVVDTPRGRLRLVHWHLGLSERERHWQAEHLLHHRLFRESAHLPTLVAGDFNDWRNTLARGPLGRAGLAQVTTPISRFRSFPAWLALGSLDKAFCCHRVRIAHARTVRTRLARRASDHLPLVVDFEIH